MCVIITCVVVALCGAVLFSVLMIFTLHMRTSERNGLLFVFPIKLIAIFNGSIFHLCDIFTHITPSAHRLPRAPASTHQQQQSSSSSIRSSSGSIRSSQPTICDVVRRQLALAASPVTFDRAAAAAPQPNLPPCDWWMV